MMFRWINKQPGIQKFWNVCSHYQDIYDWISLLNKWSGSPFILTQQSLEGIEYGKSSHLSIFLYFFEARTDAFKLQFSGLPFYTLSKTLITCRDMQLSFFKVEILLNNAFKGLLFFLLLSRSFPAGFQPSLYRTRKGGHGLVGLVYYTFIILLLLFV